MSILRLTPEQYAEKQRARRAQMESRLKPEVVGEANAKEMPPYLVVREEIADKPAETLSYVDDETGKAYFVPRGTPSNFTVDFPPGMIGRDAPLAGVKAPKKYRNRPTGGYASAKEARRAEQLKLLLAAGAILNLREQVPFVLIPAQHDENRKMIERQCIYVADFVYEDVSGTITVEDCKGFRTPDYVLKRKMLLWFHGIRIKET
jgi:hypothetical protein